MSVNSWLRARNENRMLFLHSWRIPSAQERTGRGKETKEKQEHVCCLLRELIRAGWGFEIATLISRCHNTCALFCSVLVPIRWFTLSTTCWLMVNRDCVIVMACESLPELLPVVFMYTQLGLGECNLTLIVYCALSDQITWLTVGTVWKWLRWKGGLVL